MIYFISYSPNNASSFKDDYLLDIFPESTNLNTNEINKYRTDHKGFFDLTQEEKNQLCSSSTKRPKEAKYP